MATTTTLLKCDDCQKHDGLFQCCHCHQRLCIRCCNKHHKKVTVELEQLHTLTDRLKSKVLHIKNDLERQKNEALEQTHKWRLDTINIINRAHQLVIQTIHHEYEFLSKDYEDFVDKEMLHLNIDKNHLSRMKRDNVGSLISSLSVTPVENDSDHSIDAIRQRIEAFAKQIDETGKFSFQVILPNIEVHETPKVESCFGDVTRSSTISWENEPIDEQTTTIDEQKSVQDDASTTTTENSLIEEETPAAPRRIVSTPFHCPSTNHLNNSSGRRHTYTFHRTLSIPPSFIQHDHHDLDESQRYDGIIARRRLRFDVCSPRRRTTAALSSRSLSVQNDRLLKHSWFYNPTVTTASFIQ